MFNLSQSALTIITSLYNGQWDIMEYNEKIDS